MLYIDGKPVPSDPATGQALANIQLVNGQWVLASNIGKDVMPEFRAIPEKLLRDAVFFEDKASKKKIGYIDANRLAKYYSDYKVPQGAGYDQFKKDLSKAASDIKEEWLDYYNRSNQQGLMPEITRRGEQIDERLVNFEKKLGRALTSSVSDRYSPITSDGNIKREEIPPIKPTPDTTLSPTFIQSTISQEAAAAERGVTRNPWSSLNGLDFNTIPGQVKDADGNTLLILTTTDKNNVKKVYTTTLPEFNTSIASMPKEQIKKYQAALKAAGQWNYEVNGELNYLNRPLFNNALLAVAEATTTDNIVAYTQKGTPKTTFDILNQAAKAGAGSTTSAQTYIINRESAQSALDDIYLNSIGRKANKKEVDEFYRKVQKEAKARPTVRTDTGSAATTRQGFSGETLTEMASAQAEARPEFLAYQLSTNFYNALLGASQLPIKFGAGEAPVTGPLG